MVVFKEASFPSVSFKSTIRMSGISTALFYLEVLGIGGG